MTADTALRSPLRVGQVLKSIWSVVSNNILLLSIVAIVTYLAAWKFSQEAEELIGTADIWKSAAEYIAEKIPDELEESLSGLMPVLMTGISYFILLQVGVTTLAFDALKSPQIRISPRRFAERFERAEFLSDALRAFCILMIVLVVPSVVALFTSVVLAIIVVASAFLLPHAVEQIHMVAIIPIVVLFWYIVLRWSLAVPITVVENLSVRKSLISSWRMTRTCWIRLGVVFFGLYGLVLIIGRAVLSGLERAGLWSDTAGEAILEGIVSWVFNAVASVLSVIAVSVFYYYLRGDKKLGRLAILLSMKRQRQGDSHVGQVSKA